MSAASLYAGRVLDSGLTKRQVLERRWADLRSRRSSWDAPVKDILENMAPYLLQMTPQNVNLGDRRDQKLINTKPLRSVRTLSSGIMAGATSPARAWKKVTTANPDLAKHKPVRVWLDQVDDIIDTTHSRSNLYKALSSHVYPSMCTAATGPMFQEEAKDDRGRTLPGRLRFRPMLWGSYVLDVNSEGRVDVCMEEMRLSVRQAMQRFGDRCSVKVRDAYRLGNYNQDVIVYHSVTPNTDYDQSRPLDPEAGKPFTQCWWEQGSDKPSDFLEMSGYEEFPVLAPRWQAAPTDAYGRGPGWDVRGDCRELQHWATQLHKALDLIVSPPMKASDGIKRAALTPSSITFLPKDSRDGVFEPAVLLHPGVIEQVRQQIDVLERSIGESLFEHLWNMLILDERNQRPTATEVEGRRQEVMLQLGPLLEGLNTELLEPLVERTFRILERADLLPPLPDELVGAELKIEFVSIMHTMQSQTGLVGIQALLSEVARIHMIYPDVIGKVDFAAVVDDLAGITGVRPDLVLSKEEFAKLQQARAEAEQQQQMGEGMLAATQGAKNLGSVEPARLSQIAQALAPVAAAQGGALGSVRNPTI